MGAVSEWVPEAPCSTRTLHLSGDCGPFGLVRSSSCHVPLSLEEAMSRDCLLGLYAAGGVPANGCPTSLILMSQLMSILLARTDTVVNHHVHPWRVPWDWAIAATTMARWMACQVTAAFRLHPRVRQDNPSTKEQKDLPVRRTPYMRVPLVGVALVPPPARSATYLYVRVLLRSTRRPQRPLKPPWPMSCADTD
ncbi:hypothetical protein GGI35DRAFT_127096 [Trichoderma velutinum]